MQCVICKSFLPPGMTKPIKGTKVHKCIFCEQGKDRILNVSSITGDIHWDIKEDIVREYKSLIDKLAFDQKERQNLIRGIKK